MKANESNLLTLLDGKKQFIIPIYQRDYSWSKEQCQTLWNDIINAAQNDNVKVHFIGSIVYVQEGLYNASSSSKFMVIDGQQRLTTLMLLLCALANNIKDNPDNTSLNAEEIRENYLINRHKKDDERYKLVLNKKDKDTFFNIIDSTDLAEVYSKKIFDNYNFFIEQIKKSSLSVEQIYKGIAKVLVVDITLDSNNDNPQLIFESLNSTGLDLSQSDLIRNYVLMGLSIDEQKDIYQKYWIPMEQSFGPDENAERFDRFIRDYLTIKNNGKIPKINDVYVEFKRYIKNFDLVIIDEIKTLHNYSKVYTKLIFAKDFDERVNEVLNNIKSLKVDVSYPFLLEVYSDYQNQVISQSEFIEILKSIESYVLRRAICGIPTNSLNKTFANLYCEIDKEYYLESFKAVLMLKDSYKRFPRDEEFIEEFKTKDVYNFRNRNYILEQLENFNNKEKVISNGSIEHIMPQELSDEWKSQLGKNYEKIHPKYLHTIGNLTFTGYNSEYNNRSFKQKRDMRGGYKESRYKLNKIIAQLDKFTEFEIKDRADALGDLACKIWATPEVSDETLSRYKRKINVTDYKDHWSKCISDISKEIFEELRKRMLNIDSSVKEEYLKHYIAFKNSTNFADIEPRRTKLKVFLNMEYDKIDDPKGVCRDVSNIGHLGNGAIEFIIDSIDEIEYSMKLIKQSFELNRED